MLSIKLHVVTDVFFDINTILFYSWSALIDDEIHPLIAVKRGLAKPNADNFNKTTALFADLLRRTSTPLLDFALCDVDGQPCAVVAISKDANATSDEDAKPGELFKEGMLIKRILGYESGPWWYEVIG